jgi:dienelactone hydrolase
VSVDLTAVPRDPLADVPLWIRVEGLDHGGRATVAAEFAARDRAWRGAATFEADGDGRIDLAADAPVDGDYRGVRPMGLVQLARATGAAGDDGDDDADVRPLELSVAVDGAPRDQVTVRRRVLAPDVDVRRIDDDELVGDLLVPPGDGPHPGVVVLGGSGGGVPNGPRAKLLASRGYAVLAPAYFQAAEVGGADDEGYDAGHLPERLSEVPVEYAERAVEWFCGREAVRPEPVGVVGGSRGSELAFEVATRVDAVRTVAATAPSGYRFAAPTREGGPAWTAGGEPLPYVESGSFWRTFVRVFVAKLTRSASLSLTPSFRRSIAGATDDELAAAAIPVEAVGGPVLLLSGGDDRLWPSRDLAAAVVDRLDDRAYGHGYEHVSYDDAGHLIAVPYLPTRGRATGDEPVIAGLKLALGGTPEGYADADPDAWRRLLAHLDDGLGGDALAGLRADDPTDGPRGPTAEPRTTGGSAADAPGDDR